MWPWDDEEEEDLDMRTVSPFNVQEEPEPEMEEQQFLQDGPPEEEIAVEDLEQPLTAMEDEAPIEMGEVPSPEMGEEEALAFNNSPSPMMDRYQEWLDKRPVDEEASFGRKALGGLAAGLLALGGNQQGGLAAADEIIEGGNRRRRRQWEEEGRAIGEVGKLESQLQRNNLTANIARMKDSTTRKQLEAKVLDINKRHEVALANAKTSADRAKAYRDYVDAYKTLNKETASSRAMDAGSRRISAEAARTRAGAAVTAANSLAGQRKKGKQPTVLDQIRAESIARQRVLSREPSARLFIVQDSKNPGRTAWRPAPKGGIFSREGWSSTEAETRQAIERKVAEEKRRILAGGGDEEEDLGNIEDILDQ